MKSINNNFFYNSVLTTANYIFPFITYPYISRVLGVENIGLCNFVDSIINYFIIFSMMGMSVLGIREIARVSDNRDELNSTFSSLLFLNSIMTVVMLVALIVSTLVVSDLHENWNLMCVGAVKLIFNLFLIEWLYRGLEEFKYITIRTVIVRSLYVISIFFFVKTKNDYLYYYLLSTLTIVLNAVINVKYSKKFVKFSFKVIDIKKYIRPFMSLGIYRILTSMYTSFNVTYLGFMAGNVEVGYYTTATKLYQILLSLFTAFTGVMMPRMSYLVEKNDVEEFKRLANKSLTFLLLFTIPIIMYSIVDASGIVRIVAGSEYGGAIFPMQLIMPLMLIVGLEQIYIEQMLMPLKKDKVVLVNSIVGAVIGVLLNILFVPRLHSIGSAIVLIASESTILVMAIFEIKKYLGVGVPWDKLLKFTLIYSPLLLIFYGIHSLFDNCVYTLIADGIALVIYFIVINQYVLKEVDLYRYIKPKS